MPTAEAARTLRAAAEVFIPSDPASGRPGASDIEADLFIAHTLDLLMPGLADALPAILDEAARASGASSFAAAAPPDRARALVALEEHEQAQVRQVPRLLAVLTTGAYWGEWTGQDEHGHLVERPIGWDQTGFDGPSVGRRRLLHP